MDMPRTRLLRHPILLVVASFLGCSDQAESPTQPVLAAAPALTAAASEVAFTLVSVGAGRNCGVAADQRGYCWNDERGPILIPGGLRWLQLSAGGTGHVCGIATDNLAYCFGPNFAGQLGDGTTTTRDDPVPVFGGRRFRSIRAGGFHTCAVTFDDRAYCWGKNSQGETGDSSTSNRRERPKLVAGQHAFRQVVTGWTTSCGVTTDDRAFCWGNGSDGQIGDGKTIQRNWPRAVAGGLSFRVISVGSTGTCAITTGTTGAKAYCWGGNDHGQVGDGTTTRRLKPVPVAGGRQYRLISRGGSHTCATTTADKAFCWGDNDAGALGDGTRTDRLTPVAVAGELALNGVSADMISEGTAYTCGRTSADRAYCWGSNFFGQLGDGTTTDRLTPTPVAAPQ